MLMKANNEIWLDSGQVRATGELDADRQQKFAVIPKIIQNGTFFKPRSEAEARELLEAGAARWAQKGEAKLARDLAAIDGDEEMPLDRPMMTRAGPSPRDTVAEAEAEDDGRDLL